MFLLKLKDNSDSVFITETSLLNSDITEFQKLSFNCLSEIPNSRHIVLFSTVLTSVLCPFEPYLLNEIIRGLEKVMIRYPIAFTIMK